MAKWHDDIRALEPYEADRYAVFDLNRLAVFVISVLQERRLPLTFEAIVVAAFRLFPTKFGLLEFEEFPDAARANRALLQLRPKYRNWATGDVRRGFVLTDAGKRIVDDVRTALNDIAPTTRVGARDSVAPRSKDLASDLTDVEKSPLFRLWTDTENLASNRPDDVYALLGAYPGVPRRALRDRLELLKAAAEHSGHAATSTFLSEVRRRYRSLFSET
jgi:hypothetical protein